MTDRIADPASGQPARLPEILVTPPGADTTVAGQGAADISAGDPWAAAGFSPTPPGPPPGSKQPPKPGTETDPWSSAGFSTEPPPAAAPERQVGKGEAVVRGVADTATLGLTPALAGAAEAAKAVPPEQHAAEVPPADVPQEAPGMADIADGLVHAFGNHPDPAVRQAFEAGRQRVLNDQQLAHDQQFWSYFGGQLAGAMMLPAGGASAPGTFGARALRGAIMGGIGSGAYTAGTDVSRETPLPEMAGDVAINTVEGMGLGAATGGVLGPRAPRPGSPGQRAAATAQALNAPLPKGIASDSRAVRSSTAAAASIPIFGARIRNAVDATREAAGNVINQSGVDEAIDANRTRINNLYDTVRARINPDQPMAMPRTAAALARVRANRTAARQANPGQGLEQFDNIAQQGASFNGAHRARVDAREAGDALNPHPGYNAADYNLITRAMTADIRANVHAQGGNPALAAFDRAERQFGPISTANKFLNRIARARGPGAGLDELGFNPATGEFSLDKFVTAWNKLNPQARPFVPEAAHARNIQAIFEMGQHIKSSLRERNTSHTSTPLIMWDLARDAIMTGAAVGAGVVSGMSVVGSGAAALPAIVLAHWVSSPARAASMAAWARAYRAYVVNPSPARIGVMTIATRNLANTLGLDPNVMVKAIQSRIAGTLPGRAEDQGGDQ